MTTVSCSGLGLSCASGPRELLFGLPSQTGQKKAPKATFLLFKPCFLGGPFKHRFSLSLPEIVFQVVRALFAIRSAKTANSLVLRALFAIESEKNANSLVLRALFKPSLRSRNSKNCESIIGSALFEH